MAHATATLRFYRQSPRKVRLVADMVRGKGVEDAVTALRFTTKRAAKPLRKLIESARANARDKGLSDDLTLKTITVDEGVTLKRGKPRAMMNMDIIRKRTSHIHVELAEKSEESKKTTSNKKEKTVT